MNRDSEGGNDEGEVNDGDGNIFNRSNPPVLANRFSILMQSLNGFDFDYLIKRNAT